MMISLHRYTALLIALLLMLISVSGMFISLEEDYRRWQYPQLYALTDTAKALNLADIVQQIRRDHPALIIEQIVVKEQSWVQLKGLLSIDDDDSHFWIVDPITGKFLGERPSLAFFELNLSLHKTLLSGKTGQWLVGTVSLLLSLVLFSGLISYLPRQMSRWLRLLDFRPKQKRGRSFWLHLHSVLGFYSLIFVLSSSVTGVNLSFSWASNSTYWLSGLHKQSAITAESNANDDLEPSDQHLEHEFLNVWASAAMLLRHREYYQIDWPYVDDWYDVYRVQTPALDSLQHDCKKLGCQTWLYDRIDGSLLSQATAEEFNNATKFQAAMLGVHTGLAFGALGKWSIFLSTLGCFLLSSSGTWLYLAKLHKRGKLNREINLAQPLTSDASDKLALIECCQTPIKVVYISHSGNAKIAASQGVKQLKGAGFNAQLYNGDQFDEFLAPSSAATVTETIYLFYVSTTGAGETPANGVALLKILQGYSRVLRYAIFALGDSAYADYCRAGERLASVLQRHHPLLALQKSEHRWLEDSQRWLLALVPKIASAEQWAFIQTHNLMIRPVRVTEQKSTSLILHKKTQLTADGALNSVYHLQFEGDLSYNAGDLLGIYAKNNAQDVTWIIQRLGLDGAQLVEYEQCSVRLDKLLQEQLCLYPIAASFHPQLQSIEAKLDLKSALILLPNWQPSIDTLLQKLLKLRPRYYSIASAPAPNKSLDLCVSLHKVNNQQYGMSSGFLCHQLERDQSVRAFVKPNHHFQLPAADKNIIMIATGSGVAPFIGFMQARMTNSGAQNWLILGHRHPDKDYLFKQQINSWSQHSNVRLDLSFSRVAAGQYVQHHIQQNWSQIIEQLRGGAVVYVCGSRQLGDVIREIFSDHELWPHWLENQQYREDIFG
ncbi:MAG: PepSY domain-containing protein [Oceanospirillaceae bacterium]|nr:PepSY domain-containing protein [Oceanospirillaceae bacterium]